MNIDWSNDRPARMLRGERTHTMNASTSTQVRSPSLPEVLSVPAAAAAAATTWDIDPTHASAGFRVRHLMVSHVRGHLGTVTGTVVIDEKDPARSRVDVSIAASAIETREPKRDE